MTYKKTLEIEQNRETTLRKRI